MPTPNTGIPYVPEGTQDPAAGLNLALNTIDALLQTAVIDMDLTAPPGSPNDGDLHIVADSATGDWAGQDGNLARYVDEGDFWQFYDAGDSVHVILNRDDNSIYAWNGSAWVAAAGLPDAPSDGTGYVRKDGTWVPESGGGGGGSVDSVNGRTGAVTLTAADTPSPVVTLAGDTYTLDDLTPGSWHVFTSATAVTITVEDDSVEPVPANSEYGFECRGSGGITLVEDNDADIIPPKGGTRDLETGDFAVLKRTDEDEYKLVGSTVSA